MDRHIYHSGSERRDLGTSRRSTLVDVYGVNVLVCCRGAFRRRFLVALNDTRTYFRNRDASSGAALRSLLFEISVFDSDVEVTTLQEVVFRGAVGAVNNLEFLDGRTYQYQVGYYRDGFLRSTLVRFPGKLGVGFNADDGASVECGDATAHACTRIPGYGTAFTCLELDLARRLLHGAVEIRGESDSKVLWRWSAREQLGLGLNVPSSSPVVNYTHFNSVCYDSTRHSLLVSSRSLSSIVEISLESKNIIDTISTRTYGIVGDPYGGFGAQHDVSIVAGNMLTLFDNGLPNRNRPSRGVVYRIDRRRRMLEHVRSFVASPPFDNRTRLGGCRRSGDTYLVSWGGFEKDFDPLTVVDANWMPVFTVFDQSGAELVSLHAPPGWTAFKVAEA